ncbi:hypothetical protein [Flammeovirga sp. SJP92]|uniref:hypothetical protein n=1 Tax=Flammeovirga sp. SJP92 TaxID=1775430 RepID=UPI000787E050|nr:hypothetical protein [Flammeovirga sp. SJP92]KXX66862.1 hypothetical protein AVL50_30490 [Flammeovirga sp. SJP92]
MTTEFNTLKGVIWIALIIFLTAKVWSYPSDLSVQKTIIVPSINGDHELQMQALSILQNKCNTCHRKRNPFMIFSQKNMNKRAPKIKKQVFELGRMPKEDGTPLTEAEYSTLQKWIDSLQ